MNRKETTKFLGDLLVKDRLSGIGKYYASEVSLDYGTTKVKRVDFMQFCPAGVTSTDQIEKGEFICYEIKSCIEDVFSGNGLNFVGEQNYIVTTMETWKKLIPRKKELRQHIRNCNPESTQYFGVMVAVPLFVEPTDEFEHPTPLTPDERWTLYKVIPCRRGPRNRSMTELLFYMLRSGK